MFTNTLAPGNNCRSDELYQRPPPPETKPYFRPSSQCRSGPSPKLTTKSRPFHGSLAFCVKARLERASTLFGSISHERARNSFAPSLKKRKKTALIGTP